MNLRPSVLLALAFSLVLASCKKTPSPEALLAFDGVIPKPVSAVKDGGVFFLSKETVIVTDASPDVVAIGEYLKSHLMPATWFPFPITQSGEESGSNSIRLTLGSGPEIGDEGYDLTVTADGLILSAYKPAGLFRGVQTIRQMLPEKIESPEPQDALWEIATGKIRDYPRYAWRGSMLDLGRHFFGVEDVKRYIDFLAYYKMNTLHLHLTDDQGWRIEIKSWPDLTIIGGSTQVDGGKGGFFTQEQYRDIVAYAQQRYIMIVPEVDLPGHTNAALASYGELNSGIIVPEEGRLVSPQSALLGSKNKPTDMYIGRHVGFSTLRYEKPVTFKFVGDVLRELAAMTPGPYLHIGGDEAHVTAKADYIKFVNRFKQIVGSNGKRMMGWNEIAQGELDSTDVAHFWDNQDYARMAAEKGARILMSPAKKTYLDMQYDSLTPLGQNWAAYIEVDSAYLWDPSNYVDGLDSAKIIGVEAPLWTETIVTMEDIEFMVFPRLPCIAEVGWTLQSARKWDEYKVRLGRHGPRMSTMNINFYKSPKVPWMQTGNGADSVKMSKEAQKLVGFVPK